MTVPAENDEHQPRLRRMSLVTETMARGVKIGSCFPPSAKCIDWQGDVHSHPTQHSWSRHISLVSWFNPLTTSNATADRMYLYIVLYVERSRVTSTHHGTKRHE